MKTGPQTVEQWRAANDQRLIDCRWGCRITPEACRAYQSRRSRYILHFNGQRKPFPRVNADYLQCVDPEPCVHFMPDDETDALRDQRNLRFDGVLGERSRASMQAKERERLVSPDHMLNEAQWTRSLVTK